MFNNKSSIIYIVLFSFTSCLVAFIEDEAANIEKHHQVKHTLEKLKSIKKLKVLKEQDLEAMAFELHQSNLPLEAVTNRMLRYLDQGMVPFRALDKAIMSEERSIFKKQMIEEVSLQDDSFINSLKYLSLDPIDHEKVIRAYAVCIYPMQNKELRFKLTPKLGDPVINYDYPQGQVVHFRTKPSAKKDKHFKAYRLLMAKSVEIAENFALNDFEKITMAKCIAEQVLRFYPPQEHPLKAAKESAKVRSRSPEKAFFRHKGVCTNFCAITYNIAREMDLGEQIFTGSKGFHTYLEVKIGIAWFHFHPFNSLGADFIRFN